MNHADTIVLAKQIVPMSGAPPLRDAALVVRKGKVVGLGPVADISYAFAAAEIVKLGEATVLPGLVNAHTHLELSNCDCESAAGASFIEWITGVRRRRLAAGDSLESATEKSIAIGVAQCLKFGVTTVGDVAHSFPLVRRLLAASPLRAVSYGEALGLGRSKATRFDPALAAAAETGSQTARVSVGVTPHAPYTVDLEGYRRAVSMARERGLPITTHLAEDEHEEPFLREHRGPFRDVWDALGDWEDSVETLDATPIEMAAAVGLLDLPKASLAHVNYCSDAELELLARGQASVVYCPRTHRYFRRPAHRWREMLARGVNVAVGTDSTASSPDLNVLDELRLLRELAPDLDVNELWSMATTRAARALGMAGVVGELTVGAKADFIVFEDASPDVLTRLLDEPSALPSAVWIDGRPISSSVARPLSS